MSIVLDRLQGYLMRETILPMPFEGLPDTVLLLLQLHSLIKSISTLSFVWLILSLSLIRFMSIQRMQKFCLTLEPVPYIACSIHEFEE